MDMKFLKIYAITKDFLCVWCEDAKECVDRYSNAWWHEVETMADWCWYLITFAKGREYETYYKDLDREIIHDHTYYM